MSLKLGGTYERNSDRSLWTLTRIEMNGRCVLQRGRDTLPLTDDDIAKNYTYIGISRF